MLFTFHYVWTVYSVWINEPAGLLEEMLVHLTDNQS